MNNTWSSLKTWLRLSATTFLLLIAINFGLPALFLVLRVPSFAIGNDAFWILRWENTASGFGLKFNLLPLLAIAVVIGLVSLSIKLLGKRRR